MTKFAQGAVDLHSGRSTVDFDALAALMEHPALAAANTALEAYEIAGPKLPEKIAQMALARLQASYSESQFDIVIIDRAGQIIGQAGP